MGSPLFCWLRQACTTRPAFLNPSPCLEMIAQCTSPEWGHQNPFLKNLGLRPVASSSLSSCFDGERTKKQTPLPVPALLGTREPHLCLYLHSSFVCVCVFALSHLPYVLTDIVLTRHPLSKGPPPQCSPSPLPLRSEPQVRNPSVKAAYFLKQRCVPRACA